MRLMTENSHDCLKCLKCRAYLGNKVNEKVKNNKILNYWKIQSFIFNNDKQRISYPFSHTCFVGMNVSSKANNSACKARNEQIKNKINPIFVIDTML